MRETALYPSGRETLSSERHSLPLLLPKLNRREVLLYCEAQIFSKFWCWIRAAPRRAHFSFSLFSAGLGAGGRFGDIVASTEKPFSAFAAVDNDAVIFFDSYNCRLFGLDKTRFATKSHQTQPLSAAAVPAPLPPPLNLLPPHAPLALSLTPSPRS